MLSTTIPAIVRVGLNSALYLILFYYAAIVSVLTESWYGWDSTVLYPSHLQGSLIIGSMIKIMFASALMYGLLLLVKPSLHFTPTLNVLVYAVLGGSFI